MEGKPGYNTKSCNGEKCKYTSEDVGVGSLSSLPEDLSNSNSFQSSVKRNRDVDKRLVHSEQKTVRSYSCINGNCKNATSSSSVPDSPPINAGIPNTQSDGSSSNTVIHQGISTNPNRNVHSSKKTFSFSSCVNGKCKNSTSSSPISTKNFKKLRGQGHLSKTEVHKSFHGENIPTSSSSGQSGYSFSCFNGKCTNKTWGSPMDSQQLDMLHRHGQKSQMSVHKTIQGQNIPASSSSGNWGYSYTCENGKCTNKTWGSPVDVRQPDLSYGKSQKSQIKMHKTALEEKLPMLVSSGQSGYSYTCKNGKCTNKTWGSPVNAKYITKTSCRKCGNRFGSHSEKFKPVRLPIALKSSKTTRLSKLANKGSNDKIGGSRMLNNEIVPSPSVSNFQRKITKLRGPKLKAKNSYRNHNYPRFSKTTNRSRKLRKFESNGDLIKERNVNQITWRKRH